MSTAKPTSALINRLKSASTATIVNVLVSYGYRNVVLHGVTPLNPKYGRVAGPAYTLRFIPAREDIDDMSTCASTENVHRRAIEECPPGSVLVIDDGRSCKATALDAARYEEFVHFQIAKGRPIFGFFPATAESRAKFET